MSTAFNLDNDSINEYIERTTSIKIYDIPNNSTKKCKCGKEIESRYEICWYCLQDRINIKKQAKIIKKSNLKLRTEKLNMLIKHSDTKGKIIRPRNLKM